MLKEDIKKDIFIKLAPTEYRMDFKDIEMIAAKENGDYATNIAFKLAKRLNKDHKEIAKEIVAILD